jgi:hypothetical protein
MRLSRSLALIALLLFTASCKDDPEQKIETDPAYGEYIYAFTSGAISSSDAVLIRLAEPYSGKLSREGLLPENLLTFSPEIKGKTYWEDDQTLRFEPAKNLPGATVYKGELNLSMLMDVAEDMETFVFQFQTIKQDLSVYIDGLETYSNTDLSRMKLKGKIHTADVAEPENIKAIFSAKQEGKSREIDLSAQSDRVFAFTVKDLKRGEDKSKLMLTWNWESGDTQIKGSEIVEVPSLSDFEVMKAQVERDGDQKVTIHFSDPLADQNLKGLITIEDIESLKFVSNGNKLEIFPDTKVRGQKLLQIEKAVKNVAGYALDEQFTQSIAFELEKP